MYYSFINDTVFLQGGYNERKGLKKIHWSRAEYFVQYNLKNNITNNNIFNANKYEFYIPVSALEYINKYAFVLLASITSFHVVRCTVKSFKRYHKFSSGLKQYL